MNLNTRMHAKLQPMKAGTYSSVFVSQKYIPKKTKKIMSESDLKRTVYILLWIQIFIS